MAKHHILKHKQPRFYKDETVDELNTLSMSKLNDMKNNNHISSEQYEELIDYAYKVGNPLIYRTTPESISDDCYCYNFVWINQNAHGYYLNGNAPNDHLIKENNELLSEHVYHPLKTLRAKQPLVKIFFWYDSAMMVNARYNVDNTQRILKEWGLSLDNIEFKDIRVIDEFSSNPEYMKAKWDIFMRVDAAKAVIPIYLFKNYPQYSHVINCDSDVVAITKEHLFDKRTNELLDKFGIQMGSTHNIYENSFIILHRRILAKNYIEIMIDESINEINKSIKQYNDTKEIRLKESIQNYIPSIIFAQYPKLRKVLCNGINNTNLSKPMVFPRSKVQVIGGLNPTIFQVLKKALEET